MEYALGQLGEIAGKVVGEARRRRASDHATLITFSGDLGAGKTTLIQEIAKQLGVEGHLQSPTFVIYKKYPITLNKDWNILVHGDMYRLDNALDIEKLGWSELLADPNNLICIEWPEKIKDALPDWAMCVVIRHMGGEKRSIEI